MQKNLVNLNHKGKYLVKLNKLKTVYKEEKFVKKEFDENTKILAIQVLEENGIYMDEEYEDDLLEMDSISFMSVITGLEETFNMYIPVKYINNPPKTFIEFLKFIEDILNDSETIGKKQEQLREYITKKVLYI